MKDWRSTNERDHCREGLKKHEWMDDGEQTEYKERIVTFWGVQGRW